ncbi:MAG: hypothetical protein GF350_12995, partial [Chitinivibrionales bacterium]|nr:hypothetical protein [Chitinivibrionales bacterium]
RGIRDDCDMMLITRHGIIIRSDVGKISIISRNAQGVRLINLEEGDEVVGLALCDKNDIDDNGDMEKTEPGENRHDES